MNGSEDGAEEGVTSRKGKDAFGASKEYLPRFDKRASEIENELSNETQKQMFRERLARRRVSFSEQIARHESSEMEKYEDQTAQAGISISQDEAVRNFADPAMVGAALNRQKTLIETYAKTKGFSPEQTKNALTKSLSTTHTMIVGQMLESGEEARAKSYFEIMKDEMTGEDFTRVSKAVEAGTLRAESMKTADAIYSKNLSLSQAQAEVRKIEDPKLRDETMRRVRDDYQQKEQAETEQKRDVFQASFDKVRLSKGNIDAVSPTAMTFMDADQVKALESYASDLRSGKTIQTDPKTYSDLITMSSVPAMKDKFLQTDLLTYVDRLSSGDFQELTKMQAEMRKGESSATNNAFATKDAMIKSTLSEIGIDVTPGDNKKQAVLIGQFHRALNSEAEAYKQAHGKYPQGAELQKMIDTLVEEVDVEDPGAWFDPTNTKSRFQVESTEKIIATRVTDPSKLTSIQRSNISAELKARGIAVTNQNIVDYYNRQASKK
jgi:lambda repressor-like predicted transcriptional regulator